MHPNTQFRQTEPSKALAFAADQGFGVLMLPSVGLHASHIPFVLSDDATALDMHLVRSNPLARALTSNGAQAPALLVVQGPHAYISPDWYGVDDQVPTWNYVAVHLTGRLVALNDDALRGSIDRLSAAFEGKIASQTGKALWQSRKMSPDALAGMMKAIRPFRFEIEAIDSTYKLSQNKPAMAVEGAMTGLRDSQVGSQLDHLIDLMGAALDQKD